MKLSILLPIAVRAFSTTPDINECNGYEYPADPATSRYDYSEDGTACAVVSSEPSWGGLPPCQCESCGCTADCCKVEMPDPDAEMCNGVSYPDSTDLNTNYEYENDGSGPACGLVSPDPAWNGLPPCRCESCGCMWECCTL